MKEKIITILVYALLALVACAVGIYWVFVFAFDDIVNYYQVGILKYIFILIILAGILLPILKYRKYIQKWILPLVLCFTMLLIPVFNNGILKFVEDSLETFSKEKWAENEYLRIYMLGDWERNYEIKGRNEEYVKDYLGEPDFVSGENAQYFQYNVGVGFMEAVTYYVRFENGIVTETGTHNN